MAIVINIHIMMTLIIIVSSMVLHRTRSQELARMCRHFLWLMVGSYSIMASIILAIVIDNHYKGI